MVRQPFPSRRALATLRIPVTESTAATNMSIRDLRSSPPRFAYCALLVALLIGAVAIDAQSPEWPQWGGITRDFKTNAKGLASSWPDGGPRRLWSRPLGEGYSSIVVDNGTLYTMYRKGNRDVVVALEAATGKTVWEYSYDAPFIVAGRDAEIVKEYHLENGTGPASTPLIVGDVLFAVGPTGIFTRSTRKPEKSCGSTSSSLICRDTSGSAGMPSVRWRTKTP